MVECTRLENGSAARYREFESHRLRKMKKHREVLFHFAEASKIADFVGEIRTDFRFTLTPVSVGNQAPRIFSSDGEKKLWGKLSPPWQKILVCII